MSSFSLAPSTFFFLFFLAVPPSYLKFTLIFSLYHFFLFFSHDPCQSSPLLFFLCPLNFSLTFSVMNDFLISLSHTSPSLSVALAPAHPIFYSFYPNFTAPLILGHRRSLDFSLSSLSISSFFLEKPHATLVILIHSFVCLSLFHACACMRASLPPSQPLSNFLSFGFSLALPHCSYRNLFP